MVSSLTSGLTWYNSISFVSISGSFCFKLICIQWNHAVHSCLSVYTFLARVIFNYFLLHPLVYWLSAMLSSLTVNCTCVLKYVALASQHFLTITTKNANLAWSMLAIEVILQLFFLRKVCCWNQQSVKTGKLFSIRNWCL